MLKLDAQRLEPWIALADAERHQDAITRALASLRSGTCPGGEYTGWIELPRQDHSVEMQKIRDAATEIQHADCLVVVGIGGSYLGARAVLDTLTPLFPEKQRQTRILFFGHHLSADYATELLRYLDDKTYYVNVISKSGGTTEPGIAFRMLLDHLGRRYPAPHVKNHILVTTDPEDGALRAMAKSISNWQFDLPANIGGRFSVLTAVGLLPLAVAGIRIEEMLRGAHDLAEYCAQNDGLQDNTALQYAAHRYQLHQSGRLIELLGIWEPRLASLAEWWKQLYGESEGKQHKGLFPASVVMTTDLHSLGQYIQDGLRILFETFLVVDEAGQRCEIPHLEGDPDGMNYLAGRDVADVNRTAYLGTALAHHSGGVPNMTLHLPRRDAYYLGQLIYFFEYAVAVSGLLLGVNPFDQPGVENYKDNMFALLGKPGYEELRRKLKNLM